MTHSYPTRRSADIDDQQQNERRPCDDHDDPECLAHRNRKRTVGLQFASPGDGVAAPGRAPSDPCGASGVERDHCFRSVFATSTRPRRSEEHTSELQSLMRISYAVFCLKKKTITTKIDCKETS